MWGIYSNVVDRSWRSRNPGYGRFAMATSTVEEMWRASYSGNMRPAGDGMFSLQWGIFFSNRKPIKWLFVGEERFEVPKLLCPCRNGCTIARVFSCSRSRTWSCSHRIRLRIRDPNDSIHFHVSRSLKHSVRDHQNLSSVPRHTPPPPFMSNHAHKYTSGSQD